MLLGVIDSGLGGVAVLKALYDYKNTELQALCLVDQKNAPYGNRSKEEIFTLSYAMLKWLRERGVSDVLVACNTICANAFERLQAAFVDLKLIDIIDITLADLTDSYQNILVLATAATVNSNVYLERISKITRANIQQQPLSQLASLIENQASEEQINDYLKPLAATFQGQVDAVILGCTHYALVKKQIGQLLPKAKIFDSNSAIATFAGRLPFTASAIEIYTTKDAELLKRQIDQLWHSSFMVTKVVL